MIVRKTLEEPKAEGGRFDKETFDSFTDADIGRMIDEDPDLAPRNEDLEPLLESREVRRKLGLTPPQFAKKLGVPVETVRAWERRFTPADPVLQALLLILDRMPKSALRALDHRARKAG
ncbi:MAG: helix-turn-helix domain-containing protein [Alphaproteobacteria bacterium]|nr:helix-turn-helix domain-containing protein [Alphaproteobacteria bacterium]